MRRRQWLCGAPHWCGGLFWTMIEYCGFKSHFSYLRWLAFSQESSTPTTDVWMLFPKFFTANIIFGSYLGVVCFRPEKLKQPNTQNHGQGTYSARTAENTRKPPKFSAQFVCPSPKVWDFRKKLSLGVRNLIWNWWFVPFCPGTPCKYPSKLKWGLIGCGICP